MKLTDKGSKEIKANSVTGVLEITFKGVSSLDEAIHTVHEAIWKCEQDGWKPQQAPIRFNLDTGSKVKISADFVADLV